MISETMPLNEWPIELLKLLQFDLEDTLRAQGENKLLSTLMIWDVVNKAIKDVEFEDEKAFDRWTENQYLGDGNFADNH